MRGYTTRRTIRSGCISKTEKSYKNSICTVTGATAIRLQAAGTFYLLPNGVFLVENRAASIVESHKLSDRSDWRTVGLATQSGPLLVYDGYIHPDFKMDSVNFNIRNGVGVINAKTVVFIISRDPVSLYDFAAIFKEDFHCDNALYLDGFISRFYLPELNQSAANPAPFAGILAVTSKKGEN